MKEFNRFAKVLLLPALLLSLLPFATPTPASAAVYAEPFSVALTATFASPSDISASQSDLIAGYVSTTSAETSFTFEASCSQSSREACSSPEYVWEATGSPEVDVSGSSATMSWTAPGVFVVSVSAVASVPSPGSGPTSGYGKAQMVVIVSPYLADFPASSVDTRAALAAWASSGALAIPPCGAYVPGSSPLPSASQGQALYCASPDGRLVATTGQDLPSNGIDTSKDCATYPAECGAPPALVAAVLDSNLDLTCTAGPCEADLVTAEVVSTDGLAPYIPDVCVDNVTTSLSASATGPTWVTTRGVEPGCATVRDMMEVLLSLFPTSSELSASAVASLSSLANLVLDPGVTAPSPDWYVPSPASSSAVQARSAPDSILVPTSIAAVVTGARATTTAGQTYTGSLYVYSDSTTPVELSLMAPDGSGGWEEASLPVTGVTVAGQWTRMSVTGLAPASQTLVAARVPASSPDVYFDDASLTASLDVLDYTTGATAAPCPSGPQPDSLVALAVTMFPSLSPCDTDAALTKNTAATMLNLAVPDSGADPANYQDSFRGMSLTAAEYWSNLGSYGVPVPGSMLCPDRPSDENAVSCYNGAYAMTREELAGLIVPLLTEGSSAPNGISVSLFASSASVDSGGGQAVSVRADAPADLAAGDTLRVASSSMFCPQNEMILNANHTAFTTCFLNADGEEPGTTFTASATVSSDSTGERDSGSLNFLVTSPDLIVPQLYLPSSEGSADLPFTAYAVAPSGSAVTVGVRSCLPSVETCSTLAANFPQTGLARTDTDDEDPGAFSNSARTEVGSVVIVSQSGPRVELELRPYLDPTLSGYYTNGPWDFVLQVCDAFDNCTTTLITAYRDPVDTAPLASPVDIESFGAPLVFSLPGEDSYDVGRYEPATVVDEVVLDSIPADVDFGTLEVKRPSDPSFTPAAAGVSYPASSTFRWTPSAVPGSWAVTYRVRESVASGSLFSASTALTFTLS